MKASAGFYTGQTELTSIPHAHPVYRDAASVGAARQAEEKHQTRLATFKAAVDVALSN